ncbi:MAG: hypothetical protein R3C28_02050 [Pirellulaceae bacterium]
MSNIVTQGSYAPFGATVDIRNMSLNLVRVLNEVTSDVDATTDFVAQCKLTLWVEQ